MKYLLAGRWVGTIATLLPTFTASKLILDLLCHSVIASSDTYRGEKNSDQRSGAPPKIVT